jgi:hypothetical protein
MGIGYPAADAGQVGLGWGCPFFNGNGEIPKMSRISGLFGVAQIGIFHFQFPSSFVKLQDSKSWVNIFVL